MAIVERVDQEKGSTGEVELGERKKEGNIRGLTNAGRAPVIR